MVVRIVGVSGNVARPSRTRAPVGSIVGRAAGRLEARGRVVGVSELAPSLGVATGIDDLAPVAPRLNGRAPHAGAPVQAPAVI